MNSSVHSVNTADRQGRINAAAKVSVYALMAPSPLRVTWISNLTTVLLVTGPEFIAISDTRLYLHHVSKNSQNFFWHNFVKFPPTLIIFGPKMAKTILLCMVHSFTTSPNLCQCTTMWNTDAPNCYIMRRLFVSNGSPLHHQFDRGCNMV